MEIVSLISEKTAMTATQLMGMAAVLPAQLKKARFVKGPFATM